MATPLDRENRPGLGALVYRVGTYASFFETMKARLSRIGLPSGSPSLLALKTRDQDDPAIAWLDACAVVTDILTFYQERIANEGYLRTATERRSILELAALVGYALRPGVSSSTYLAYTLDAGSVTPIPAGSKAQSLPGPGEVPQTFETSVDLDGAGAFSNLAPRLTRPQVLTPGVTELYVAGVSTNLSPNDPLLVIASPAQPSWITAVNVQPQENRTRIVLQAAGKAAAGAAGAAAAPPPPPPPPPPLPLPLPPMTVEGLIAPLSKPPAPHLSSSLDLTRPPSAVFDPKTDTALKLLQALHPEMQGQLYAALKNATVTQPPTGTAHAFRVRSAVFGHNAAPRPITDEKGVVIGTEEWPLGTGLSILIQVVHMLDLNFGDTQFLDVSVPQVPVSVFVRITRGATSGSATLSLAKHGETQSVRVGEWPVKATVTGKGTELMLDLDLDTVKRSYKIVVDAHNNVVTLTVDKETISAPFLQKATLDTGGRHTLLSITPQGILVTDDSALAADSKAVIHLDAVYERIVKDSYVIVVRADNGDPLVAQVADTAQVSLSSYGISGRVTRLTLNKPWLGDADVSLSVARSTTVFAQSEQLELASEPVLEDVSDDLIELGDLYDGLAPGRWVIVEGERTDIDRTSGVVAAELMMVASLEQRVQQAPAPASTSPGAVATVQDRPGEVTHSFLRLSRSLAYRYKRDTVTIYGNVVQATNGERRNELLGSGDGGKPLQQFNPHVTALTPLTYVSAPTADGVASTLQVFVNGVQWHEVDSLAGAGPLDRCYTTEADNEEKVTITFGDGRHGMRLPSGPANVRATYRVGIGSGGNLARRRISMLTTKPLGVTSIINPLPASGGADRDTRDAARRNVPTAAVALNRLVSVQDHADFARTFGGVGKASAAQLSDGRREIVFVTIAGASGALIDASSALLKNLLASFEQLGDPHVPVSIGTCTFRFLVIVARVKVVDGQQWTSVGPRVSAALRERFSFDQQDLGEPVFLSTVIATVQNVPGVAYVVVDGLDSITVDDLASAAVLDAKFKDLSQAKVPNAIIRAGLARRDGETGIVRPAEVVFLHPDAQDTLLLSEITS